MLTADIIGGKMVPGDGRPKEIEMIRVKLALTPKQAQLLRDAMECRDYDEGSILHDAGIVCWDSLQEMLRGIDGRVGMSVEVASMLEGEAREYADLWGEPALNAAAKRIVEAIGLAHGIQPPAKPKPKPRPKKQPPVPHKPADPSQPFKLAPPPGVNHWCGPTALGALLQTSTDHVAELAKQVGGRKVIKGMTNGEAIGVVRRMGFEARQVYVGVGKMKLTLAQWHKRIGSRLHGARYLVNVTDHYVAVHDDRALCSLQPGRAVRDIAYAACARRKVCRVWEIVPQQPTPGEFRL